MTVFFRLIAMSLAVAFISICAAAETYTQKVIAIDGATITAMAFTSDGTRLAFAKEEGTVSIRDTMGGPEGEIIAFQWPGKQIGAIAFNADGSQMAAISTGKELSLWDVSKGLLLKEGAASVALGGVSFSPNGALLFAPGQDGKAHLFDATNLTESKALGEAEALITAGAFSPNGALLATVNLDKQVTLWEVASGKATAQFAHEVFLNGVSFSADGKQFVTAGRDGQVTVFDVDARAKRFAFQATEDDINDATFSPDGSKIVTAATDDAIGVWDAATGAAIVRLEGHLADVVSVRFGADGTTIYSLGQDATGRVWTTRAAAGDFSALAGLWRQSLDFGGEEPVPPEITRSMCLSNPVKVQANGLVVWFEGYEPEPPRVLQYLRCAADLTCDVFGEEPKQGARSFGTAKLFPKNGKLDICGNGECLSFDRCEAVTWSDSERQSGFAAAWEAATAKVFE